MTYIYYHLNTADGMQSSMGGRVIDCTHVTLGHVVLDNATPLLIIRQLQ